MSRIAREIKRLGADIQHISSVGAGSTGRDVLFWYAKIQVMGFFMRLVACIELL